MNRDIKNSFEQAGELTDNDVAAAILVLAQVIHEKETLDRASALNFGHDLALSLKNVLSEASLTVNLHNLDVD